VTAYQSTGLTAGPRGGKRIGDFLPRPRPHAIVSRERRRRSFSPRPKRAETGTTSDGSVVRAGASACPTSRVLDRLATIQQTLSEEESAALVQMRAEERACEGSWDWGETRW